MSNINQKIKEEATSVLTRVLLFLLYYVGLIVLGICLFVVAGWITIQIPGILSDLEYINIRLLIFAFLAFLAMWYFCIEIGLYLIRPLLGVSEPTVYNGKEVSSDECPELFSLIDDVASKTGNPMPSHVYITSEVNASVSYDSVSLWSVFFPPKKNLTIGTGLLYGMNKSEIKAILSHEFGHFSQETMRIGTLTYRLLLVTRDIFEFTQERQKDEAIAKAKPDYKWYFHLASGPINFITKQTINFYRYIEKKNRSLSRYMEFEADNVACKNAGVEAHISALCKLDILSQRHNIFENGIATLLSEGHYLEDYFEGYKYMFGLLAEDESLHVDHQDILSSPISDETAFASRVRVIDGWNTHPSLGERIDNAKAQKSGEVVIDKDDACNLIPLEVFNSVGENRQKDIAVGLDKPVSWGKITPMTMVEFKTWLPDKIKNHKLPHYLQPFVNKAIVSIKLPSDEELVNEEIMSPFTKENRDMMLEFTQAGRDWDTLVGIKQSEDEIHFTYDGKEIDISSAIEQHKSYLESFNSRLEELDKKIYKYIWKHSEDKPHLHAMYWLMFFSNDGLHALQRLHQAADEIISTMRFYKENGSPVQINDDYLRDMSKGFREVMTSFDFDTVSTLCGGWDVGEGKTVNQLLQEWQEYLAVDSTSFDGTVNRIEEVWYLLARMFNVSNGDWLQCMVSAYEGVKKTNNRESN